MALCYKHCLNLPPKAIDECESTIRSGGISHFIFAKCDLKFKDITNPAEWCEYVRNGDIVISNTIAAQKPKGNFTTKLIDSCSPEDTVGIERTITFYDYNSDEKTSTDFDFWQTVQKRAKTLKFGYVTCDGNFYGFIRPFSLELGYVIEETKTDCSFWDGTISWLEKDVSSMKPKYIHNIVNIASGNCHDVLNFDECQPISGLEIIGDSVLCKTNSTTIKAPFVSGAIYIWRRALGNEVIAQGLELNEIEVDYQDNFRLWIERTDCPIHYVGIIPVFASPGKPVLSNPAVNMHTDTPGYSAQDNYSFVLNHNIVPNTVYKYGWKFYDDPTPISFNSPTNVFAGVEDGHTYVLAVKNMMTGCITEIAVTFDLSQATPF